MRTLRDHSRPGDRQEAHHATCQSLPRSSSYCLAAAGCGDDGDSAGSSGGPDKVKVGAIPIVDVAPLHLGKEKGFFNEQNIDLEVVNTTGGAAAVPGVVSGEFQFAFGNVVVADRRASQDLPLKAVANGNASTGQAGKDFGGVVVPKDSPISVGQGPGRQDRSRSTT